MNKETKATIASIKWEWVADELKDFVSSALALSAVMIFGGIVYQTFLAGFDVIPADINFIAAMWPIWLLLAFVISHLLVFFGAWIELGRRAGHHPDKVFFVIYLVATLGWLLVFYFGLMIIANAAGAQ